MARPGSSSIARMVSGLSLEDMSADDALIVNSWFRHDEASTDTAWFPPGFRVDDELSQPGRPSL